MTEAFFPVCGLRGILFAVWFTQRGACRICSGTLWGARSRYAFTRHRVEQYFVSARRSVVIFLVQIGHFFVCSILLL